MHGIVHLVPIEIPRWHKHITLDRQAVRTGGLQTGLEGPEPEGVAQDDVPGGEVVDAGGVGAFLGAEGVGVVFEVEEDLGVGADASELREGGEFFVWFQAFETFSGADGLEEVEGLVFEEAFAFEEGGEAVGGFGG